LKQEVLYFLFLILSIYSSIRNDLEKVYAYQIIGSIEQKSGLLQKVTLFKNSQKMPIFETTRKIYILCYCYLFMKAINNLHEALLNRGKIFKKEEITQVTKEYKKIKSDFKHKRIIEYLSKHNYIKRIFFGYYYINSYDEKKRNFRNYSDNELLFYVLNKEKIKWYLGLNTAIYEQGKTWQTPNIINIINTRISGKRKILGVNVRFIKTKEKFLFGLKELKTKNNISYFYSDPAKTYIDKVYFKDSESLVRVKNTQQYLKRYPKWVGKK